MNENDLIQWVRGALPPDERRAVTEWMIRCRDPQLPLLLDGIMQAERDAQRDRALTDLGPRWSALVQGWQTLLERGAAVLMDAPAGDFAMASLSGVPPVLQLMDGERGAVAILSAPEPGHYRLVRSDDSGRVELLGQAELQPGDQLRAPIELGGQRGTIWALSGAPQPQGSPLDQLADALSASKATTALSAIRLDPREG